MTPTAGKQNEGEKTNAKKTKIADDKIKEEIIHQRTNINLEAQKYQIERTQFKLEAVCERGFSNLELSIR